MASNLLTEVSVTGPVISFGEAFIDFRQRPARHGHPLCYEPCPGGAPANVATAIARLGGIAAFVGTISEDALGHLLVKHLGASGVDTQWLQRTHQAQTALAIVSLDKNRERDFNFYRAGTADLLFRTSDFQRDCLKRASAFHVCSNTLTTAELKDATLQGMRWSAQSGSLVSFDVNLRPALWPQNRPVFSAILEATVEATILKATAEEFEFLSRGLGGEQRLLKLLFSGNTQLVLVTAGSQPIRYFTRTHRGSVQPPSVQIEDTTGAGDAFVGGLLYSLQRDQVAPDTLDSISRSPGRLDPYLRFATVCGALATTQRGSLSSMPTRAAVAAMLAKH